jgi:hypothetical protein
VRDADEEQPRPLIRAPLRRGRHHLLLGRHHLMLHVRGPNLLVLYMEY